MLYTIKKTTNDLLIRFGMLLIWGAFMVSCFEKQIGNVTVTDEYLEKGFASPPDSVKPYVYWYWLSDNISKEGITKDLESMARVGIGEAFIGNIGLSDIGYGKVKVLTDEWWQMIEFAIREGNRLGVNIGMFNSPGWSQSGGPWVKPSQAMRYLISTEYTISGNNEFNQQVKSTNDFVQNVAVLAYPLVAQNTELSDFHPALVSKDMINTALLFDGRFERPSLFTGTSKTIDVDISLNEEFTARGIVLYPAPSPFTAKVKFLVNENGRYKVVKEFLFDRSNPSPGVGPMIYGPVAIALNNIRGRQFRLTFEDIKTSNGTFSSLGFTEISIRSRPVLENYVEKQLGKMHQTPLPLWKEYQWENQSETGDETTKVNSANVIDLTKLISSDGRLTWKAPAGQWRIVKIDLKTTGATNKPSSPEGTGLEVDKMNKKHVANHFQSYIGELLRRMPAADRTAFRHVVADSYEVASQNWTDGFADEFKSRYQYDPIPWLPTLTGSIVESADKSNRFLWDLRRLVADKVAYDYVGGLRELCEQNGLQLWLENYGHWGFPSEFLMYGGQSQDIGGEFWAEGELGNIECKAASSACHIYGKKKVFAESFTAALMPFKRDPAMIKKRGDWSFTEGVNHVLLHVYIHQAYEDRNPGMNAWFGTEFNRKNTWFEQSKSWIDYERRCMFLLQQGLSINDVCYFIGEDAPKMTGVREPEIPKGYDFDYINAEVLINRVRIQDGRIVLPDGMSYRILVLPPLKSMRPELAEKIKKLVEEGMVLLGPAPEHSPSLQNYPKADERVKKIAVELWGNANDDGNKKRKVGKGMVLRGMDLTSAMKELNEVEDVHLPSSAPVRWVHRKMSDTDIYFITNQSDKLLHIEPVFRVVNKQPELWDATSGVTKPLVEFAASANTTSVPLQLQPAQSYFVIFRKNGTSSPGKLNFPNSTDLQLLSVPWQIQFDPAKQGPVKPVLLDKLQDWSTISNDSIRYYSGAAVYRTNFNMNEKRKERRVVLSLGDVKSIATVKVNGQLVGTVWTSPYELDVTDALVSGRNELEVEVVNLWVNRMIGDKKLPEKKRATWTSLEVLGPNDKLEPSGLLGPVTIFSISN